MDMKLEIIKTAIRKLAYGESQPAFGSDEFADLMDAIKSASASPADHQQIGAMALNSLLDFLSASMNAERTLKIMRGGDDQFKTC